MSKRLNMNASANSRRPFLDRPSTTKWEFVITQRLNLRRVVSLALVCIAWLSSVSSILAGCGPENVFLVVNANRIDSMTIANHYISLRQIPDSNVLFLNWEDSTETITSNTLRRKLLEPIFAAIDQRRLTNQIDMIVYSSGFPFAINYSGDVQGQNVAKTTGNRGSLTGMTYLADLVRANDPSFMYTRSLTGVRSNYYEADLTRGFSSQYTWGNDGRRIDLGGRRYYLSVMLGYTEGRGNTVDEVLNYLRRSALADATHPDGTIYLMRVPGEIRSQTRDRIFPQVAAMLQEEGVRCLVEEGILPYKKKDVMGAVLGKATLNWPKHVNEILPGAICEHLTSFGGNLSAKANHNQTVFTETLKYGVAGSSGTVVEPYAIAEKFPTAWMHLHYVRGLTLAESFYHSIASPYQLLIAGDPLCRPWANIPEVEIDGVQSGDVVKGTIHIVPRIVGDVPVKELRLFVDGRYIQSAQVGDRFTIDTTKVADGHHEVRVVAIENSPIESQGRVIVPMTVDNRGLTIDAASQMVDTANDGRIEVTVSSPGAEYIYLFHNRRPVSRAKGDTVTIEVSPDLVGRGPVRLKAVGVGRDKQDKAFAQPIEVVMDPQQNVGFQGIPTDSELNPTIRSTPGTLRNPVPRPSN